MSTILREKGLSLGVGHLDGRGEMMQLYADYIGRLGKDGGVAKGAFRKMA